MRITLALLTLLMLGAGCNLQTRTAPEPEPEITDPVALAQSLGEFGFTLEGRKLVWWRRPKEMQLEPDGWWGWPQSSYEVYSTMAAGGMVLMGYPIGVPTTAEDCQELPPYCEGGVGERWVKVGADKIGYMFPLSDYIHYIMSLPDGKIEAEQYVRLRGQWYRFVARAQVKLDQQRTRIDQVEVFPTEAYRLDRLPEVDYFGTRPPVNLSAVCSNLNTPPRDQDLWSLGIRAPHMNLQWRNRVQVLWYRNLQLYQDFYQSGSHTGLFDGDLGMARLVFEENRHYDPPPDNYYDLFVRLVSQDPRTQYAYGRWWRVYNQRPITIKLIDPVSGEWRCTNMDAENLFHWEGPFTKEELIARYGFDPDNPPQNLPNIPR
jgi:hypothetical protein